MARTKHTLLPVALLAMAGCVQYVPVELATVPPSQEVRVSVTTDGAVRLARVLGRLRDDVTASVAPQQPDSIAVTIWLGKGYQGTDFENVRETVVLPRDEVTALNVRTLSKWRTVALSGAALVGALIMANQIFQIGDPNRGDDDGNPPPPADVTFARIPLRWIPGGAR